MYKGITGVQERASASYTCQVLIQTLFLVQVDALRSSVGGPRLDERNWVRDKPSGGGRGTLWPRSLLRLPAAREV
jgi:hypothetical protein